VTDRFEVDEPRPEVDDPPAEVDDPPAEVDVAWGDADTPEPAVAAPEPAVVAPEPESLPPSPGERALEAVDHLSIGASPELRLDDAWAEAGRKVLRFHLARSLAQVPALLESVDPAAVHDMRVATRRMRAAWRVFGEGFEREARRRYLDELRALGSRLGIVRDLDVRLGILTARTRGRTRLREGLEPVLAAWLLEREARGHELAVVLSGEAFASFVADYETFAETPGLAALELGPTEPALVRHRIGAAVWSAYQEAWAFDPVLASADLATLHQLRIAAKWLRYTLEFIREPLDPDASALIRPVVALQDRLGDLHDLNGTADLARAARAATTLDRGQDRALGKFIAELDEDVTRLGKGVARSWRPIAEPRYRRALGQMLARV
jgi:CHAD domain-containing protein